MKVIFISLVAISLISAGTVYVQSFTNPCGQALSYSVGSFDPRFGISQKDFIDSIQSAERVWEQSADRDLFSYDPEADFKINLIFDERQQKTIDERNARQIINLKEGSYEKLVGQYNVLKYQHELALTEYNEEKSDYETRLKSYNTEVAQFNKTGGASQEDIDRLNAEKKALTQIATQLERDRVAVNGEASSLNALIDRINQLATNLNLNVDDYNGKYGTTKQFDQGVYTGNAINIYQFNELSDLQLVLAHELGHALTLDHVEEPSAIMYYLMGEQNLQNIQLTEADLTALQSVCH